MANKIPWYITVDWKSIKWLFVVLFILIGIGTLARLPDILRNNKADSYEGITVGSIRNIKENTRLRHGYDGTDFVIESYTVDYNYELYGVKYKGTDEIKATAENKSRLEKIANNNPYRTVKIKYDLKNQKRSLLILNE